MNYRVHKVGGTSVVNAERYQKITEIIFSNKKNNKNFVLQDGVKDLLVVSAMKGVTDDLIQAIEMAKTQNSNWKSLLDKIKTRHIECVNQLLTKPQTLLDVLETDIEKMAEVLKGLNFVRSASQEVVELISGMGEVWSAQILNAYLNQVGIRSQWLDAREFLKVESSPQSVQVLWEESSEALSQWMKKHHQLEALDTFVMTGFIASTKENIATTLKRNGSDFSGSILAHLLKAKELYIWTDVDGIMSADPRLVSEAKSLPEMTYQEVAELAYFGAHVIHPATMTPAIESNIPIIIKNSFNPDFQGTRIHSLASRKNLNVGLDSVSGGTASAKPVRGFSIIENISLINIEGTGMMGVPGISQKLFSALKEANVNVVLISQASSEHSICFAIHTKEAEKALQAAQSAFYAELKQSVLQNISITHDTTILAAVGDNMIHLPGVAGIFFQALAKAKVNVKVIAQGSSERNISVVVDKKDGKKALRAAHSAFYLSPHTLSLGIIGTGLIGKALIEQLQAQIPKLLKEKNIDIRLRGIMNTKTMRLGEGHSLHNQNQLDQENKYEQERPSELKGFVDHIASDHYPHFAIIDATASAELPSHYTSWLGQGIHIITPNKKAASGKLELFDDIYKTALSEGRHFLYSTNVGAGLPILRTLHDIHHTGDRILSLEGVVSGTLSFIFNQLQDPKKFGQYVQEAMKLGFTEPDPRDDLGGMDVYRKLIIMARTIGVEPSPLEPQNLVGPAEQKLSKEEFLNQLSSLSLDQTLPEGHVLRYVASIEPLNNKFFVGLKTYPLSHPFAKLNSSDNMLIIKTERYSKQPLIIQGPGAGPEVTAGGVFADILRLMNYLGAPL